MKLVLVDDHQIFRAGIRQVLSARPDWQIAAEASRAREALALIDAHQPDVVVMDIALPGMDGVVATREIRRRAPSTRVLIVTVHDDVRDAADAFDAGAAGYALKTEAPAALLEALAAVARGGRYVAPSLDGELSLWHAERASADVLVTLSQREREVFRLAAECLVTRDIAQELCISRKTVVTHLYRIYRKLNLRTAADLVRFATRLGAIHNGRIWHARPKPPAGSPPPDVTRAPPHDLMPPAVAETSVRRA